MWRCRALKCAARPATGMGGECAAGTHSKREVKHAAVKQRTASSAWRYRMSRSERFGRRGRWWECRRQESRLVQ